jgi:spore coat protein U-like protein
MQPMFNWARIVLMWTFRIVAIAGFTTSAHAQTCTASMDQLAFGTVKLGGLGQMRASSRITVTCTGLANETVRLCPTASEGEVTRLTGGAALKLTLYSNFNQKTLWNDGIDIALDGTGAGQASRTIEAGLSNALGSGKAGQYTGLFNPMFEGNYVSAGPRCAAGAGGAAALRVAPALRKATVPVAKK